MWANFYWSVLAQRFALGLLFVHRADVLVKQYLDFICTTFLSRLCPPCQRTRSAAVVQILVAKYLRAIFGSDFPEQFFLTLSSPSEDLVLAEERTSKKDRQRIMEGGTSKSKSKSKIKIKISEYKSKSKSWRVRQQNYQDLDNFHPKLKILNLRSHFLQSLSSQISL